MIRTLRALTAVFVLSAGFLWSAQVRALEIQEVTSPGGITGWLVEDHDNPILTMRFSFARGEASAPADKEGIARLLAGTLDEGAGDLSSQAFQKALADDSITVSFNAQLDRFSGRFVTLTETRDQAVELLRLAVNEPRFDAEPVQRIRAQIEASLRRAQNRPRTKASRAFWSGNFPDHPYGRAQTITAESVSTLTADDLRAFRDGVLVREGLKIAAVGDITPSAFGALMDTVFGDLPETSMLAPVPDAAPALIGETIVIDDAVPQSQVMFGHDGIRREHPDWYALSLLNEVLAGGFGSRLTEEIREKRGLVYGVYAYPLPLGHAPMIMGGLATENARVAQSIALVRQEWARLAKDGPTAEEVSDARAHILGTFALRLADSNGVASILLSMQISGLPIDYLDQRRALFEAVTAEDLKRVAAELYKADALTMVVVGQPEGVDPTIAAPGG